MQTTVLPDHVVSEALAILLKHQGQTMQTKDGHLINSETSKSFPPRQQLEFHDRRIKLAVNSFLNGVGRHLAALRRQQNHFSPFHRLPNEIIASIFEKLVEDYFARRGTYDIVVKLIQVSSRWRDVALSTARLWTHIDGGYCELLVTTSIARSRRAPLHLFISDLGKEEGEAFLTLTMPHMARWETVQMDLQAYEDQSTYLEDRRNRMPLLKKFEVCWPWCYFNDDTQVPDGIWYHAPRLQSLDITQFSFPKVPPSFSGLRQIRFLAMTNYNTTSAEQWYSFLASCPELEDIHAEVTDTDSEQPLTQFQASLPRLKTFSLRCFESLMIGTLLLSICSNEDDPPSINLDCSVEGYNDQDLFEIALTQSTAKSTLLSFINKITVISAQCCVSESRLILKAGTESKKNLLGYNGQGFVEPPWMMFRTLVPPRVLPNLKDMDLTGSQFFQDENFLCNLHPCTSLERLSIRYPDPEGQTENFQRITQWLAECSTNTSSSGVSYYTRPCPNLKYLEFSIRHTDFSPLTSSMMLRYGDDSGPVSPKSPVVSLLELRLSSIKNMKKLPSKQANSISRLKKILCPLGTVVQFVDNKEPHKDDRWSA